MTIDDASPRLELKQHIRDNVADGLRCPVCESWCKVYDYKLNRRHAALLLKFYDSVRLGSCRLHNDFAHAMKLTTYTTPKHWGLIERCEASLACDGDDDDSENDGLWCITQRGEQFLKGQVSIPQRVSVLHDTVIDSSAELETIRDVWGRATRFKFADVLGQSEYDQLQSKIDQVLCIPTPVPVKRVVVLQHLGMQPGFDVGISTVL